MKADTIPVANRAMAQGSKQILVDRKFVCTVHIWTFWIKFCLRISYAPSI